MHGWLLLKISVYFSKKINETTVLLIALDQVLQQN